MKPSLPLALVAFISTLLPGYLASGHEKRNYNDYDYFALEHDPSDASLSRVLASLGLELVEQAGSLENTWLVRRQKEGKLQSKRIVNDLVNLRRRNRGGLVGRDGDGAIFQAVKHFSQQIPRQRIKRDDSKLILRAPPPLPTGNETSASVAEHMNITDPVFHDQWYLVNDEFPIHMVNAAPVWESGNAGEGVIAAMVDDGLDFESDDLADNFVSSRLHSCASDLMVSCRTPSIPMISICMCPYRNLSYLTITMGRDVQAKSPPSRMTSVASASRTKLRLLEFASSPDPSPT